MSLFGALCGLSVSYLERPITLYYKVDSLMVGYAPMICPKNRRCQHGIPLLVVTVQLKLQSLDVAILFSCLNRQL